MLKYGNVLRNVKVNDRLGGMDVEHSQPLNDSFLRLTSRSLETCVCLFLAVPYLLESVNIGLIRMLLIYEGILTVPQIRSNSYD